MRRIILLILCFSILSVFLSSLASTPTELQNTDEMIGAYNHLTLCFALVRNGLQVESIRRDILGNVNLASLPIEVQQLYKSLLQICDKALAGQQEIAHIETNIEKQKEQAETRQAAQFISSLLGNPQGLLSLIFCGETAESQSEVARSDIQELKNAIVQEVSDFEFQLSADRSKLSQLNNIQETQFITTANVDEYLELQFDENAPESYYSSLALIYQRNPAMYFVAYELGRYAFSQGQLETAREYFGSVVKNTPTVLKYNPIRVDARCFLGDILVQETEYLEALNHYSQALTEDRGSVHGLSSKALALHLLGRYAEAKPLYENFLRIQPEDPTTRYNYACLLALNGTNHTVVLNELQRAFNSGFTGIAHAKSDPDLASIRESDRFKELAQIKIGYGVDWNALTPDKLHISNRSDFDWTNVIMKVTFLENNAQIWKTIIGENGIRKERLNRGETFGFEAFNSTKTLLSLVQLSIQTDQGGITAVFQNSSGQLQVSNIEAQ